MAFETLVHIIVFVNLALTIELCRRAALRPEKLKRKFRNRLWWGKPITPKHEPPPPLTDGMSVKKAEQFNSDFEDFANVINWGLAEWSPWRLQELPNFELSKLDHASPAYGRCYAVFHNQGRVGEIELEPDWHYSTEDPRGTIYIELNWVRLLAFETIRSFLTYIAVHTFGDQRGTPEYSQTNHKIDLAMMDALWKTQQISRFGVEGSDYGQITLQLNGLASFYLESRQIFRDQGRQSKTAHLIFRQRTNARGGDGGVREELAARARMRPIGLPPLDQEALRWR